MATRSVLGIIKSLPGSARVHRVRGSVLPRFLGSTLLRGGGATVCRRLSIAAFPRCITTCVSQVLLGIISFLIAFLVTVVLMDTLVCTIGVVNRLPLLNTVGRLTKKILKVNLKYVVM